MEIPTISEKCGGVALMRGGKQRRSRSCSWSGHHRMSKVFVLTYLRLREMKLFKPGAIPEVFSSNHNTLLCNIKGRSSMPACCLFALMER